MRIALISASGNLLHMGKRTVSALAKGGGWDSRLIFLPSLHSFTESDVVQTVKSIEPLLSDCDLIGFSTMTLELNAVFKIADCLRLALQKPIIFGGIGAIIEPQRCLKHADWVCITEAEGTLIQGLEAAAEKSAATPPGWISRFSNDQGEIPSLQQTLDHFPPPDFDMGDDWVMSPDFDVSRIDETRAEKIFAGFSHIKHRDGTPVYTYVLMTTRGCPHKCAYCSNALFLNIFKGKGKIFRQRSLKYFLNEIRDITQKYPFINFINFYDDTFSSRSDFEEFSRRYPKEIGLHFCNMVSPTSITEQKAKILSEAGAVQFQMGIQTGSSRILREVYKRPGSRESILKATRVLSRYANKALPRYDFILDNPYETAEDHRETIDLLSRIPKPFRIQHFSLVFYKKTELYSRAEADGILTPEMTGEKKRMSKWANMNSFKLIDMCVIASPFVPNRLLRVISRKPIFAILNHDVFRKVFRSIAITAKPLIFKLKIGGTKFSENT